MLKIRFSRLNNLLAVLVSIAVFTSCATYGTKYLNVSDTSKPIVPESTPEHRIFLIGDAGLYGEGPNIALEALGKKIREAGENSSVVFLGDNVYPSGIPEENHPYRHEAISALEAQLNIVKDYKGKVVFIPGNHDWRSGLDGLKRQEKYVEDYLDRDDVFLPENGCAGPEEVELTENLLLVVVDSEWWLQDWDKEPEINSECDVITREQLVAEMIDIIKKNRTKDIVIAMHHPFYTYGEHGGQFTFRDHVFPLAEAVKGLYIPLPIIGSLYPLLRANAGVKQDINYKPFIEFRDLIIPQLSEYENVVFVSGHEHNLQYIERSGHPFIISGSGSKHSAVYLGRGSEFASSEAGFAEIQSFKDGSQIVLYYTIDASGNEKMAFSKTIKGPAEMPGDFDFTEFNEDKDSVKISIYTPEETEKGEFYKFLWGTWYRDVYSKEITVPVMNLDNVHGGLKPVRRGGGMQTNSLRLVDVEGKEYTMRAMEKDARRLLTESFKNTFVVDLMRDFFTTAHPYAAFIVPEMADAVGVYHTNPELVYIPKQPALGMYNEDFGGTLYLFEERPDDDWSHQPSFGRSDKIIGSLDLLEEMEDNYDHIVDYAFTIRSRLFDIVISDWDRHQDQWRWASFDSIVNGREVKIYRPIPRDRDQVFADFDGFITSAVTRTVQNLRPMQKFQGSTKRINWFTWDTRFFDRRFLNQCPWPMWEKEIMHIQSELTDNVIERAIRAWPKEVYEFRGEEIIQKVKERRNNLPQMARKYYEFLAKSVDVVGTEESDYFLIDRIDGETRVQVFNNEEQEKKIFDRTFLHSETKEVIIYGLDEDDKFLVQGESNDGIKIRLVGGQNHDTFIDRSKVRGSSKKTLVYDDLRKNNTTQASEETADFRSTQRRANEYHFKEFEYPYTVKLPFAAYYSDDGFYLGGIVSHIQPGFKKFPYGQRHLVTATYAFATSAFKIGWVGEFTEGLGTWDFVPEVGFQTPSYAVNFFGLGNGTSNTAEKDYYRVRHQLFRVATGARKSYKSGSSILFSPHFESYEVEETDDRIVAEDIGLPEDVFDRQSYIGATLSFNHESKNNPIYPSQGMVVNLGTTLKSNLTRSGSDNTLLNLEGTLAFYFPLNRSQTVVYATEFGAEHIFGDFDFYHGAIIGGHRSLRGFRPERFTGRSAVYHSNDLRFPLFYVHNDVLPFHVGLTGSFDWGRVWWDDDPSKKWHKSYGGALWFSIVNSVVIQAGLHFSEDDEYPSRLVVGLGFSF